MPWRNLAGDDKIPFLFSLLVDVQQRSCICQELIGSVFRYHGVNPGTMRLRNQLRAFDHGKEHHDHTGNGFGEYRRGLKAIEFGHGEIKHHQVRLGALGNLNRLTAILRLTTYLEGGVRLDQAE
jgi:hypothetical protein